MSTINQELLALLKETLDIGITQVYWQVSRKCEATGLPREQAAIAVAMELGIDVVKYATAYDLESIRRVEPGLSSLIEDMLPAKQEIGEAIQKAQKNELNSDPFIDSAMLTAAHRNAEICTKLFVLENSIRRVVSAVMSTKYGIDWWYDVTPRDIMYTTFDRRSGEKEPKWRGQFGAEPIYYTDIKDLKVIIDEQQKLFQKFFGDKFNFQKLEKWVDIVERIRASLVYTNPVTHKDRDAFMSCYREWNKLAKKVFNQIDGK